jgi:hypothetical protein
MILNLILIKFSCFGQLISIKNIELSWISYSGYTHVIKGNFHTLNNIDNVFCLHRPDRKLSVALLRDYVHFQNDMRSHYSRDRFTLSTAMNCIISLVAKAVKGVLNFLADLL